MAGPNFPQRDVQPQFWRETIGALMMPPIALGRPLLEKAAGTGGVRFGKPHRPLHIGHGRGAAVGDTLARILRFAGYDVTTEYYINDAGHKMRLALPFHLAACQNLPE